MARFYGEMQGNRGATSRMGDAYGGFWAHIRGWRNGAEVRMAANGEDDQCIIYATEGSGYGGSRVLLGTIERNDNGLTFKPSTKLRDAILIAEGKRPRDEQPSTATLA